MVARQHVAATAADAQALAPIQRRAMEAIRDHGGWSLAFGSFANYANLVRGRGLPADPEAFARWLGALGG